VGPDTAAPLHRGQAKLSFTTSVRIPGMRRVASYIQPPAARYWTLAVSAPMVSDSFNAAFILPVEKGNNAGQG